MVEVVWPTMDSTILNQHDSARKKILLIIGILVAADVIAAIAIYSGSDGLSDLRTAVTDIEVMITTGAATGLGMLILYKQGFSGLHGKTYAALALGLAMWSIGEGLWVYDEVYLQSDLPATTMADLFWISGYGFFAYFLFKNYHYFAKSISRKLVVVIAVLAGIAVSYSCFLGISTSKMAETENISTVIVRTSYAIGDSVIVLPAILLVITLRKAKLHFSPWFFISAALLVTAAADLAFAFVSITELVDTEWIANLLYDTANIIMAGGLYWYYKYVVAFGSNRNLANSSKLKDRPRDSEVQ